jgi:hypothetical protein
VLLACIVLVDNGVFVFVRMAVTVLALICLVFAVRGRAVLGIVLTALIAIAWNPVVTLPIPGQLWAALQIVAAAAFVAVGILVKVPRES